MKVSIDLSNLVRNLNNLCEFLDNSYDINCGGCCYISHLIAKHLESLNIEYSVVILDYEIDKEDINEDEVITSIKKHKHNLLTGRDVGNHYALKIEDEIINPSSIDEDRTIICTNEIKSKDLKWIYDTGDWNDMYNIARNKYISSYIDTFFKTVKLDLL